MEVVTDKGWFLSSYRTDVKSSIKDPVSQFVVTEVTGEEDRRTSTDSGISITSSSAQTNRGSLPFRQDDSGCGSLGGSESSSSGQTDYPMQHEKSDISKKMEDSGVGLGCQLDSSSMDGQDAVHLKEPLAQGNYSSQSPSSVHIDVCVDDELKQILSHTALAEVVTGYRAGPPSCICSGAGQCTWCLKQGHYGSQVIKQYRTACNENGPLSSNCGFVDSYKAGLGCSRKTQTDSIIMDDLEQTFIQLGENFPLLTSLSHLHLEEEGQDFSLNNKPLSLCDVMLKTD